MGQAVAKVYRAAKREVGMYDIERRAQKIIVKDKPSPAPKYPSTVQELKTLEKDNISKEYLFKKDDKLDDRLKQVFVTSEDIATPRIVPPNKPLPQSRHKEDFNSYGYSESEEASIPAGRISLKQALDLIVEYRTDPVANTKPALAVKYKMSETVTDDILEHFRMFNFHSKKLLESGTQTDHEKLQKRIEQITVRNVGQVIDEIKKWEKIHKSQNNKDPVNNSDKPSEKSSENDPVVKLYKPSVEDSSNKKNDKDNR